MCDITCIILSSIKVLNVVVEDFEKYFSQLYYIYLICHIFTISLFIYFYSDYQYISVKVKWGKELFSNIEVNTEEDPILFKAQLFALTGVQPERQKVMLKGMTLKDDDWGNLKLKDVIINNYS